MYKFSPTTIIHDRLDDGKIQSSFLQHSGADGTNQTITMETVVSVCLLSHLYLPYIHPTSSHDHCPPIIQLQPPSHLPSPSPSLFSPDITDRHILPDLWPLSSWLHSHPSLDSHWLLRVLLWCRAQQYLRLWWQEDYTGGIYPACSIWFVMQHRL